MCAVDTLVKLVKDAEGFSLTLTKDRIGSALGHRAAAAKAWLDRSRAVIQELNSPSKDQAALEACQKKAEALAKEGEHLHCNVTRDVDKLRVSQTAVSRVV